MIIALYSPAARMGKTTVAERLMQNYGFERVRFAGPLKAMTAALLQQMGFQLGDIMSMVEGEGKDAPVPGFEFKPRDLMKTLGTEWGRQLVGMDLWTAVARRKIQAARQPVVIDDMRFPNEYDMLRDMGAVMVRIERPRVVAGDFRYEGLLEGREWDRTIDNDGSLIKLWTVTDLLAEVS